jgi:hypothetical protein
MNPFSSKFTQQEERAYDEHFNQMQINNLIPIPVLIDFLKSSKLDQQQLSQIWSVAEVKEIVTKDTFYNVLKLISVAQSGIPITKEALSKESRLPIVDSLAMHRTAAIPIQRTGTVTSTLPIQRTGTFTSIPIQRTGSPMPLSVQRTGQEITMNQDEKQRFSQFFYQLNPTNGSITGQQARDVFIQSGLDNQVLAQIWNLIDKGLGKLGVHDFVLAMVLITRMKQGLLHNVPPIVPAGLWAFITGSAAEVVGTPVVQSATIPTAGISPADKLQYQSFFDSLDITKKGFLNGQQCFDFFLKSGLSSVELAKVWDTVDVAKRGSIDKDGFVNAMVLIKQRLNGGSVQQKSAPTDINLLGDPIDPIPTGSLNNSAKSPMVGMGVLSSNSSAIIPPIPALGPTAKTSSSQSSSLPASVAVGFPPITMPASRALPGDSFKPIDSKSSSGVAVASSSPATGTILGPGSAILTGSGITTSAFSNQFSIPAGLNTPQASLELQDVAQRQHALAQKTQELKQFENELMDLSPSLQEIQKQREKVEKEYKEVSNRRNEVMIQVSQVRAQYEAEILVIRDVQDTLQRETRLVQTAQVELTQVQEALKVFSTEKNRLEAEKLKQSEALASMKKQIATTTEETNKFRSEIVEISAEVKQTQQYVDLNLKLVQSSKDEHMNIKMLLESETKKLLDEKKRVAQLEQQANVQEAITQRDREKIERLEIERSREKTKSDELLHVIDDVHDVKINANDADDTNPILPIANIAGVQLADSTPPPIPSTLTKPQRSSENLETSADPLNKTEGNKTSLDGSVFSVLSTGPNSTTLSMPPGSKSANNPAEKPSVDFDAFFAKPLTQPKESKIDQTFVDEFTFDTSFQAPVVSPLPLGQPMKASSFGDFTETFKFEGNTAPSVNPAFDDLDAAFGGSPLKASVNPAFNSDPFGNVDFDTAFSTPFPAPVAVTTSPIPSTTNSIPPSTTTPSSPVKTSSLGKEDSPEVKNIISMGFTREQAINALEM